MGKSFPLNKENKGGKQPQMYNQQLVVYSCCCWMGHFGFFNSMWWVLTLAEDREREFSVASTDPHRDVKKITLYFQKKLVYFHFPIWDTFIVIFRAFLFPTEFSLIAFKSFSSDEMGRYSAQLLKLHGLPLSSVDDEVVLVLWEISIN